MRDDPIISGGFFKVALIVLVAGGLGLGGYVLSGGDIGIDLPDLPEIDTAGDTTNLVETELSDTVINGDETVEATEDPVVDPGADPFRTASFASALEVVRAEAGSGKQATRVIINDSQTQFSVRAGGNNVELYGLIADTGELTRTEGTSVISGNATIDDFAFALDAIKPGAVDRIITEARRDSGTEDFRPTVLTLERGIPFGSRELEWTLNAQAGGRSLLYRASADGKNVRNLGGAGTEIPQAALDAQKLNDCIQAANSEPEQIFACLDKFQP
jgi:hypothetical protein